MTTVVEGYAWFTRTDIELAGDFYQAISLRHMPGLWWVMERPEINCYGGNAWRLKVRSSDPEAVRWARGMEMMR